MFSTVAFIELRKPKPTQLFLLHLFMVTIFLSLPHFEHNSLSQHRNLQEMIQILIFTAAVFVSVATQSAANIWLQCLEPLPNQRRRWALLLQTSVFLWEKLCSETEESETFFFFTSVDRAALTSGSSSLRCQFCRIEIWARWRWNYKWTRRKARFTDFSFLFLFIRWSRELCWSSV